MLEYLDLALRYITMIMFDECVLHSCVQYLIFDFDRHNQSVISAALRVVGNIVTGDDFQTQVRDEHFAQAYFEFIRIVLLCCIVLIILCWCCTTCTKGHDFVFCFRLSWTVQPCPVCYIYSVAQKNQYEKRLVGRFQTSQQETECRYRSVGHSFSMVHVGNACLLLFVRYCGFMFIHVPSVRGLS